ncbi:hypothetical protein MB02_10060 [Croceicoccus estronivorus]|uniref:SMP-30/gluconolactonase/LRE family protein n=1 Tax=Croceicoccus estronivorus TaxID=1172626 RepID=UPI000831B48B|nr:SMP-30/gluconolactonase/LRE family protein [Croceicoccus estronivorus]OCC23521.1 hypothetical protein MB02_10060 [Croceicoccus estronivorus]
MLPSSRRLFLKAIAGLALSSTAACAARRWVGKEDGLIANDPDPLLIADFTIAIEGLDKAEGIAIDRTGNVYLSQHNGIARWTKEGGLAAVGSAQSPAGIALDRQGGLIIAGMGLLHHEAGPLQRMDLSSGQTHVLVDQIGARQLVASNFPVVARGGAIYCSHSSWGPAQNIGRSVGNGFIYRYQDATVEVVADGLRGANGLCLDADEAHLYCALTAEGRVRRWKRTADGRLTDPEDYGPALGAVVPDHMIDAIRAMPADERAELGYCDGLAFDRSGNLWVTLPFANRLVAITPDRRLVHIAHDPAGDTISMPTNMAWGGPDGRTLHVVNRGTGMVAVARTATAGISLAAGPYLPARNASSIL